MAPNDYYYYYHCIIILLNKNDFNEEDTILYILTEKIQNFLLYINKRK